MVHTRNQPGGDLSSAVSGRSTTTTGGLVPATSCSAVTSSVTAAGDAITTGSKTATGRLLSSRPGGTFAVTSPPSGNGHFSASANATPRTRVASSDVGTSPFGQIALGSASANPVSTHDQEPSVTGLGRLFGAGAYFGPSDWAALLPPPLRPNYLGDYGRMHTVYVPSCAQDSSDLFGLTASMYRPPFIREPQWSLLDGVMARQRMGAAESQTVTMSVAEEQYTRSPNGLSTGREPLEELGVPYDIGRQLRDLVEAPQTVPNVDARPRQTAERMAPIDDGATALWDRRLAEYEARLQNSRARASAAHDAGYRDPEPTAVMGAGLLRGTGHVYLLHPDRVSRPPRLAADTTDGPWARHRQQAQRLTPSQPRLVNATQCGAQERVVEMIGARMHRLPAPRPVNLCPMEMPDSPSPEEDTDEGFVGYSALPQGIRPQPRPHQYVEPTRSGERLSQRDQFEMPRQANHEDVPYVGRYAAPPRAQDAWVPQLPGPVEHLAKMQDFQEQGSDRLDSFFDHVEELADFYRWDGRETYRQARAHLRGTALAYVKRAPFQPRTWEELKALLLKRFQRRDLTTTYKAQFRVRRRHHGEDIHTFVKALQRLANMA